MTKNASKIKNLAASMHQACKKVAPLWPLDRFVAVNPYLGLIDKPFEQVAHDLDQVAGIQSTLPSTFYLQKIKEGRILLKDLNQVLAERQHPWAQEPERFVQHLEQAHEENIPTDSIPTVADVASRHSGKDWQRFSSARISQWAASYFDEGQSTWRSASTKISLFTAWKQEAEVDRTPEISGLPDFRLWVKQLPEEPMEAAAYAIEKLGIPENGLSHYLHRLLLLRGGWSAHAARLDFENELQGGKGGVLMEFLSVLLCWELCLLQSLVSQGIENHWRKALQPLEKGVKTDANEALVQRLILQAAFERAEQRMLIEKFKGSKPRTSETKVKAQAIFCIDVRSEVFRRNWEQADAGIETLGFAGFFAFPVHFQSLGHQHSSAQCPVLLAPQLRVAEGLGQEESTHQAVDKIQTRASLWKIWKSFKSGAITCFSFVSPIGLSYIFKLFTDSLGLTRPVPSPDSWAGVSAPSERKLSLAPQQLDGITFGIPLTQQIQMAKNALKAMSLGNELAPLVMVVGHRATTVNNPHASGLDCGACGGHSGEPNAKLAAAILNSTLVREGLKKEGMPIPEKTIFLACVHDTTTDEIHIFNEYDVPSNRAQELADLKKSLEKAGSATRLERALRMGLKEAKKPEALLLSRSKDWSQVRPEWGLAGCSAFVVAPRERTRNMDLGGRSFLHSYDWKKDTDFSVLELIMTAPMVVTSWINLQYYGSTVDNEKLGAGNKVLHNVTAGIGVLEGHSGDLRVGLPMQSVHDGEKYQHEPLKLTVIIEAPTEAMNSVLMKHDSVRQLCDNGWIHLWALNENGQIAHRYQGDFAWESLVKQETMELV
ncbi:DUF2309 domain-containing protein [Cytophagales bacterium LB-30]|uniref:Probable inorganic carbon transporter subunit DabA n=1 Tax=Shiella aurantiaca TaxID=3058365 RepID=A0ABT8F2H8_9BACT|nr:DUF2309 domain-containing protein [Shiella aurantiaca]MDN4164441.1 DUF2309 domain-containing protein [Shiella aurantiaca]